MCGDELPTDSRVIILFEYLGASCIQQLTKLHPILPAIFGVIQRRIRFKPTMLRIGELDGI